MNIEGVGDGQAQGVSHLHFSILTHLEAFMKNI